MSPNPHNRQPWMVDLSLPDHIGFFVDTARMLPHTNPFNRQITVGLGCFLETLSVAAGQEGLRTEVDLFPEGSDPNALDARPVALIKLSEDGVPDPLFEHVPDRRTQKEPYDTARTIPADVLANLTASVAARLPDTVRVDASIDPDSIARKWRISVHAMQLELSVPHTCEQPVDLSCIGHGEVDANPDGMDFTGPIFETLRLTGQFSRALALDTSTMAYTSGVDAVPENMRTAMCHIWLTTAGNTRKDQIAAGRAWMRLNRPCTRLSLGTQPLSQALQEYPEMDALYAEVHGVLAQPGVTVQMWARLGYSPTVAPSPRWPLDAKLV